MDFQSVYSLYTSCKLPFVRFVVVLTIGGNMAGRTPDRQVTFPPEPANAHEQETADSEGTENEQNEVGFVKQCTVLQQFAVNSVL